MVKTLLIFFILTIIGCSEAQKNLSQDYSFLLTDGLITKLHQSNDTLYELQCFTYRPCLSKPNKHYKIISSRTDREFTIFKLEQLDTIPMSMNPYPTTRYSVLAFKNIDNKQLGYLPLELSLTRQQLDTIQTNTQSLRDKFFFTFLSDTFLRELSARKKITTKKEAQQIIAIAKSEKFNQIIERYKKTETRDPYAGGLAAEIFNQACIENGNNPIGAGQVLNTLMK